MKLSFRAHRAAAFILHSWEPHGEELTFFYQLGFVESTRDELVTLGSAPAPHHPDRAKRLQELNGWMDDLLHRVSDALHGNSTWLEQNFSYVTYRKHQRHPRRKLSMDHSELRDYLWTEPCQKFTEEFNCYPCDWILLVPPHDRNSESWVHEKAITCFTA